MYVVAVVCCYRYISCFYNQIALCQLLQLVFKLEEVEKLMYQQKENARECNGNRLGK